MEREKKDDHTLEHRRAEKRTVGASKRFSISGSKDGGAQREMVFLAQRLALMEQQMAMLCTKVADMLRSPHPRHQRVRPLAGDARQLDAHPAL